MIHANIIEWTFAKSDLLVWSDLYPDYANRMRWVAMSARYWLRVNY